MKLRGWILTLTVLLASATLFRAHAEEAKDKKKVENDPAVVKALTAAGWTDIAGSWKQVKPNIYEVTDGKVEAKRADGTLSVIIDAGGNGTCAAYVRNGHEARVYELPGPMQISKVEAHTGYGVEVDDKKWIALGPKPVGGKPPVYVPVKVAETKFQPNEKLQVTVGVHNLQLEVNVNGKTPSRNNYNISKEGPFAIIVTGTMTIEMPTVKD